MLKKRVTGDRKIALPNDPAIDGKATGADGLDRYRETLFDVECLQFVNGSKPTLFVVRPLTVKQKRGSASFTFGEHEWAEFVVRCGLLRVEDFEEDFLQPERVERPDYGVCASQEWIDQVQEECLTFGDIDLLGGIIWNISEARPLQLAPSNRQSGDGE